MPEADLAVADQPPREGLLAALQPGGAYQAPADLRAPIVQADGGRAQTPTRTGSTELGRSIANATFNGLVTPDLAQRAGLPPEAVGLMNWIMKGESNGFNELYNGTKFQDFSDHPANLGWQGDHGPDGRPTTAAGGPQFLKATWDRTKAALGLPDFSDVSQVKGAWWLAQTDYRDRTGRDLHEDLKAGHLDQLVSGLRGTWPSLGKGADNDQINYGNQAWGRGLAEESRHNTATELATIERDRSALLAQIAKEAPGSDKRMQMLEEAHAASKRATELYEKQMKTPPVYQPTDVFAGFGGIVMALAAFAGGRAAQPLTGSLNAMAGAIDGMNQRNHEAFDRNFAIWNKQTDYALKLVGIQNQEIRDILEDERLAQGEKQQKLLNTYRLFEMDNEAAAARRGDLQMQWNHLERRDNLVERGEQHRDMIRMHYDQLKQQREISESKITPGQVIAKRHDDLVEEWKAKPENQGKDVPPEVDDAAWKEAQAGSRGARSAPAMYMQEYMKEHPEATAADMAEAAAEYRRLGAIETGFASGILGRQVISLNTVADHLLLVKEYGEALNNGQIPRANAIANQIAKEMGKPEVTNFEAGRDIMADEVVRLLTSTGGTKEDREGMQSRISSAMSPQQMGGVLRVFDRFVSGRFEALEQQYAESDPKRIERFREKLLTEKSRKVYEKDTFAGAGSTYNIPADVYKAFDAGTITKEQAKQILIDKFGAKSQ